MAHVRSDKYVQRALGYHSIQLLPSMISIVSGEDDNDDLKESKSVSMKSVIHVQQASHVVRTERKPSVDRVVNRQGKPPVFH